LSAPPPIRVAIAAMVVCALGVPVASALDGPARSPRVSPRGAASAGNKLGLKTKTPSKGRRPNPGGGGATLPGKVGPSFGPAPGGPAPGGPGTQPTTPSGQINEKVAGEVTYDQRDCLADGSVTRTPLSFAEIQLKPTGGPEVDAKLDANGHFTTDKPLVGSLPVKAWILLDGDKIRVKPDTGIVNDAYLISLGDVIVAKTGGGTDFKALHVAAGKPGDPGAEAMAGAANIYNWLARGADIAQRSSPGVTLPEVTARWRYASDFTTWLGDTNATLYQDGADAIVIGGKQSLSPPSLRNEYERYSILHEYAHHVIKYVADPGNTEGGPTKGHHNSHTVHPPFPIAGATASSPGNDLPALPWSEGFADAIAAAVSDDPTPTIDCEVVADYTHKPALGKNNPGDPLEPAPKPPFGYLAQYNEVAITGALWGLLNKFGNGNPAAGLKPLLGAFHAKVPHTMRDARDALAEVKDPTIETTKEQHEDIAEILREQRINWYFDAQNVGLTFAGDSTSLVETHFKMEGAYSCEVKNDFANDAGQLPEDRGGPGPNGEEPLFELAGTGGLSHTWHDDCFGLTDGNPTTDVGGEDWFFVEFPYSGSSDPDGDGLTISMKYTCAATGSPDNCKSSNTADLLIRRGVDNTAAGTSGNARQVKVTGIALPRNGWVPVLHVDGQGRCTSLIDNADCSI
jgi:hypothetical protein